MGVGGRKPNTGSAESEQHRQYGHMTLLIPGFCTCYSRVVDTMLHKHVITNTVTNHVISGSMESMSMANMRSQRAQQT